MKIGDGQAEEPMMWWDCPREMEKHLIRFFKCSIAKTLSGAFYKLQQLFTASPPTPQLWNSTSIQRTGRCFCVKEKWMTTKLPPSVKTDWNSSPQSKKQTCSHNMNTIISETRSVVRSLTYIRLTAVNNRMLLLWFYTQNKVNNCKKKRILGSNLGCFWCLLLSDSNAKFATHLTSNSCKLNFWTK